MLLSRLHKSFIILAYMILTAVKGLVVGDRGQYRDNGDIRDRTLNA